MKNLLVNLFILIITLAVSEVAQAQVGIVNDNTVATDAAEISPDSDGALAPSRIGNTAITSELQPMQTEGTGTSTKSNYTRQGNKPTSADLQGTQQGDGAKPNGNSPRRRTEITSPELQSK